MNKKELAEALLRRKSMRGHAFSQQKAILDAYLEGKSIAELASMHSCSFGPIKRVIDRAIAEGLEDE